MAEWAPNRNDRHRRYQWLRKSLEEQGFKVAMNQDGVWEISWDRDK